MTARFEHLAARGIASTIALAAAVLGAAGCGSSGGGGGPSTSSTASASGLAPIHGAYSPTIDPASFGGPIDNRYFPLEPGTGFHFKGVRGTTPQRDDEVVTHRTKRILGIDCTVVRDTVSERSGPVERTFDYYAQDSAGNVWYVGERSLEKQGGRFVVASDSWQSGVKGAKPGIIMPANPQPGDAYRQEYYPPGQALDEAHVVGRSGTVKVPNGTYNGALVTSEFSPLEPQTERKYYVAGLGEIQERVVKGHHERFQLVSVTH